MKGLKCNIRTRSQLTCDEDTELVHGSPASPLDTLSRHSSGCDWSKGRTKTPDLLAEKNGKMIMVFAQSWTMSDLILAGLSLRSGGQGFSWATMNAPTSLFHRKIEER